MFISLPSGPKLFYLAKPSFLPFLRFRLSFPFIIRSDRDLYVCLCKSIYCCNDDSWWHALIHFLRFRFRFVACTGIELLALSKLALMDKTYTQFVRKLVFFLYARVLVASFVSKAVKEIVSHLNTKASLCLILNTQNTLKNPF